MPHWFPSLLCTSRDGKVVLLTLPQNCWSCCCNSSTWVWERRWLIGKSLQLTDGLSIVLLLFSFCYFPRSFTSTFTLPLSIPLFGLCLLHCMPSLYTVLLCFALPARAGVCTALSFPRRATCCWNKKVHRERGEKREEEKKRERERERKGKKERKKQDFFPWVQSVIQSLVVI